MLNFAHKHCLRLGLALSIVPFCTTARADNTNHFISNGGTALFLAAGVGLPLIQDGSKGTAHSLRALDSLIVSVGLSEGLKQVTRVRRPDSDERDAFPSGHTTAAFAVATMQAQFHPSEAAFWYAGAAAIGYSRVQLRQHHWTDVFAGAALGFGTARMELSSHRGLLLYPFITDNGGIGVLYTAKF